MYPVSSLNKSQSTAGLALRNISEDIEKLCFYFERRFHTMRFRV